MRSASRWGGAGAAAAARILPATTLVGVDGGNPLVVLAVIAILVAVGLGASASPARRALRLDAVDALRAE